MEAVKDLEIKQLAEDLMTAGNPFTNIEDPDNDNIPCIIIGPDTLTNIDVKNYDSKSNSSTVAGVQKDRDGRTMRSKEG